MNLIQYLSAGKGHQNFQTPIRVDRFPKHWIVFELFREENGYLTYYLVHDGIVDIYCIPLLKNSTLTKCTHCKHVTREISGILNITFSDWNFWSNKNSFIPSVARFGSNKIIAR